MNILVTSALRGEIERILKFYRPEIVVQNKKFLLFKKKLGFTTLDKHNIYFGTTGVGRKNVERFFKTYLHLKTKTDLLISTGYAGALNPSLKAGDILIVKEILCEDTNEAYSVNIPEFYKNLKMNYRFASGLETNRIISRTEKMKLRKTYKKIDFVDMESCVIAKICRENKINLIIVRAISDDLNFEFPDFEFVRDSQSNINIVRLLRYLLKNPLNLLKILHLRRNQKKAGKELYKSLIALLKSNSSVHRI